VTDGTVRGPPPAVRPGLLRWFAVGAAVLVGSIALGGVLGASTQIVPGTAEQGQGAYVSESFPAYFTWRATQISVVPTPVPGSVSFTVTAPSRLPAAAHPYMINTGTAGDTAVRWQFRETIAAPVNTELELRFTVGLTSATSKITGYVETQAAAPGATLTFTFYWDAGTFAPSSATVETMQAEVLVCTSVGVCP